MTDGDYDLGEVCQRCLSEFDGDGGEHAPRQLPCLHLLCKVCVDELVTFAQEDPVNSKRQLCAFQYIGPTLCNHPYLAAEARESRLPLLTGDPMRDQDDFVHVHSNQEVPSPPQPPDCSMCNDVHPATHRCSDCDLNFCQLQAEAHLRSRLGANHKLTEVTFTASLEATVATVAVHGSSSSSSSDSNSTRGRAIKCQTAGHEGAREAVAFCPARECRAFICDECAKDVNGHEPHGPLAIQDACVKICASLQSECERLSVHQEKIAGVVESYTQLVGNLGKWRQSTTKAIGTSFDSMIKQLNDLIISVTERRRVLIDEATRAINANIKTVTDEHDVQFVLMQHTAEALEASSRLVSSFTSSSALQQQDIIAEGTVLLTRVQALSATDVSFAPSTRKTKGFIFHKPDNILQMGNIRSLGELIDRALPYGHRDYSTLATGELRWSLGGPDQGSQVGKFEGPVGTAYLSTSSSTESGGVAVPRLVIGDQYNKRLIVATLNGTQPPTEIESIPLDDFVYGVASAAGAGGSTPLSDEIWTATYNFGLRRYNIRDMSRTVGAIACKKAYGVATSPGGGDRVAVTTYDDNKVSMFRRTGEHLWTSTGATFKYSMGLCFVGTTELVVCDRNNHRLQVLSAETGKFIRSIPSVTAATSSTPSPPIGGAAGAMSPLTGSSSTSSSPSLSSSQLLPMSPSPRNPAVLGAPSGVAYDERAQVLIVCEEKNMSVWSVDGAFLCRWGDGTFKNGYGNCCLTTDGTQILIADCNNHRILCF